MSDAPTPVRMVTVSLASADYLPASDFPDLIYIGTTANVVVLNHVGADVTLASLAGGRWHSMTFSATFSIAKV